VSATHSLQPQGAPSHPHSPAAMPTKTSDTLEKARGKVALEPGYSMVAWMRLSTGADLTGGVGLVDEDEDEETWREWSLDEVRKHNTPEDAWMVLRGKVYNVTPYLRYHPGGVDTILKAAGTDGTALFDKFHAWVNEAGILAACCVGRLAKAGAAAALEPEPERAKRTIERRRIKWDEEGIQAHDAQRGVMFGTQKIDQINTPFLYLDQDGGDVSIHPAYLKTHVPDVEQMGSPRPHVMPVQDLQDALGVVETDAQGCAVLSQPKWSRTDDFGAQRQAFYASEARTAALAEGLPDGWTLVMSSANEPFYYHEESGETRWDMPA